MGYIANMPLDTLKGVIERSNINSARGEQRYVFSENRAIRTDYVFVDCECEEKCWCRAHGCTGHYIIKDITFEQFLDTYVHLWVPPRARENVTRAVLYDVPYNGRQRNAPPPLRWLKNNWRAVLGRVRSHNKCGLCDSGLAIPASANNLYKSKIWSQLYYDSLVPYDTKSRAKMTRCGYTNPSRHYMRTNEELYLDLKTLALRENLEVVGIRELDTPWNVVQGLAPVRNGQPLSRIIDKMFYSP